MFVALGVGAFDAGIFHMGTHAFFKALLFLAAGSVIHSLTSYFHLCSIHCYNSE
jgi:NADH-quinone oxidoreductase subunit L